MTTKCNLLAEKVGTIGGHSRLLKVSNELVTTRCQLPDFLILARRPQLYQVRH